ncbi:hypothetical protein SpCBS45565_g05029 [Spizellomyces sp. 'palustris']|nr:hypothetical protein SpCBS45565_g05029 [Spizellomyces sp. 'palustris']
MNDPEAPCDSSGKAVDAEKPIVISDRHNYPDADVRIVVDSTAFHIHTELLKVHSDYFRALFNWPWMENHRGDGFGRSMREITLKDIADEEGFKIFLDCIYVNLVEFNGEIASKLLDICDPLGLVFKNDIELYFVRHPDLITWSTFEDLLRAANPSGAL